MTNLITNHYGSNQLVYQDEALAIYRVHEQYLTSVASTRSQVKLALGSGWYSPEQDKTTLWRWTDKNSLLYTTNFIAQKTQLRIKLQAFATPRTLQLRLNQQLILEQPVSSAEPTTLEIELNLPPGRNELGLLSLEEAQSPRQIHPGAHFSNSRLYSATNIRTVCTKASSRGTLGESHR